MTQQPDNDDAVRTRAYLLWEQAGRPAGMEHEFWARAADEIEGGAMSDANSEWLDEGATAFAAGHAAATCPYPVGSEAREGWLLGFEQAERSKAES